MPDGGWMEEEARCCNCGGPMPESAAEWWIKADFSYHCSEACANA